MASWERGTMMSHVMLLRLKFRENISRRRKSIARKLRKVVESIKRSFSPRHAWHNWAVLPSLRSLAYKILLNVSWQLSNAYETLYTVCVKYVRFRWFVGEKAASKERKGEKEKVDDESDDWVTQNSWRNMKVLDARFLRTCSNRGHQQVFALNLIWSGEKREADKNDPEPCKVYVYTPSPLIWDSLFLCSNFVATIRSRPTIFNVKRLACRTSIILSLFHEFMEYDSYFSL